MKQRRIKKEKVLCFLYLMIVIAILVINFNYMNVQAMEKWVAVSTYEELYAALNKPDDINIRLMSDLNIKNKDSFVVNKTGNHTLDLNGHNIKYYVDVTPPNNVYYFVSTANLFLVDSASLNVVNYGDKTADVLVDNNLKSGELANVFCCDKQQYRKLQLGDENSRMIRFASVLHELGSQWLVFYGHLGFGGSNGYGYDYISFDMGTQEMVVENEPCGKNGANVKWSLNVYGDLIISGSGAMADYSKSPFDSYKKQIKRIIVEKGVTQIGNHAFEGLMDAKEIIMPSGITTYGLYAFQDVLGLTSITCDCADSSMIAFAVSQNIVATLTHDKITKVNGVNATCIASGVKEYYHCSCGEFFEDKFATKEIIDLNSWKVGAGKIEKTKDSNHIFDGGKVTKEATETSDGIIIYTCRLCGHTKTVGIPKKQANISISNSKPKKILSKGEKVTDSTTKAMYQITNDDIARGEVTYIGSIDKTATRITIQDQVVINNITYKVTRIKDKAFKGNKKITSVVIGKDVTVIGKSAFEGCKKLKKITIKTTKLTSKKVGSKAFKGIHGKAKVKVPKSKLKSYKKFLKKKGISGKKQKITK